MGTGTRRPPGAVRLGRAARHRRPNPSSGAQAHPGATTPSRGRLPVKLNPPHATYFTSLLPFLSYSSFCSSVHQVGEEPKAQVEE
jgi:hypothetical protein